MQFIRFLGTLEPKCVLTVGGLDPTTCAGVYSDIKTLSVLKVLPLALATCLVVENSNGVKEIVPLPQEAIRLQLDAILEDCIPNVVKISLVYSGDAVEALLERLPKELPIVLDPVLKSWDGRDLITPEGLETLVKRLLPISTVVTPNVLEASLLSKVDVRDLDTAKEAARKIADLGAKCVVIKGGHFPSKKVIDILYYHGEFLIVEKERLFEGPFHGLGCTFSAALAAFLAHGLDITDAFMKASHFTTYAIRGYYRLKGRASLANPLELYYKSLDAIKVVEEVYRALEVIESIKGMDVLTPEVGMNIAACLRNPTSLEDVCGVEGRLRPVRGFLRAHGSIMFGASKHLGSMLIEVNKKWPTIKACINIKYSEDVLRVIKELGFRVASFDRSKEPQEVKSREGLSMKWGAQEAIRESSEEPDVIYDLGDVGKEPMIRVFGKDPLDVVKKIELIISKLGGSTLQKTSIN
ncbi:MAG: bifunctional hydroxymethylpyrimidine kinase/phosphomethylpyrimidine kinase [Candidatus Nezhaarchaeales archaeon]